MDFATSSTLFAQFLSRVPWKELRSSSPTLFTKLLSRVPWKGPRPLDATGRRKRVAITIGPYLFTPVPWFNSVLGIFYLLRGWDVLLVFDDLLFGDHAEFQFQYEVMKPVVDLLALQFPIVRLSELGDAKTFGSTDLLQLERLALLNAIWRLQSTEPSPILDKLAAKYLEFFSSNLKKIRSAFDSVGVDHWVVAHGIYGNSGLFAWEGKIRGVRVATYDSGQGKMIVGTNDVAGYQTDISKIFETPFFSNNDLRQKCIRYAESERELRRLGIDENRSQPLGYQNTENARRFDIVMPLNIDYDSAALGKHRFFENSFEWTIETVRHVLENTNSSIAVRQHPGERFENVKRDLTAVAEKIGRHPRFHFFSANDLVNSYQLIEDASVVLPMTSTIGVEAAMMGKRIILEANAYYSTLSFADSATSKLDYFNKISTALQTSPLPSQTKEQIEEAQLCFFLVCINQIPTDFNPTPEGFEKWVSKDLSELSIDLEIRNMIDCFEKDIPVALLRAERLFAGADVPQL
jgi:hypothetical protein